MKTTYRSEKLEQAFAALSANYRGTDIDLYEVCRERRAKTPVATGDFMNSIGVPTHAGASHGNPTFTLFKYNDVKSVLQDSATFNSRFMAKGFGSFFSPDGLVITAMDGEAHRKARGLLQPVFAPDAVLPWRTMIEHQIRDEFILPLVPEKRADLLDFGLYFPIRVIYGLIGFPDEELGNFYEYAAMGLTVLAGPKIDPTEEAASRERAMKATNTLYEATMALVKRRRAEGGGRGVQRMGLGRHDLGGGALIQAAQPGDGLGGEDADQVRQAPRAQGGAQLLLLLALVKGGALARLEVAHVRLEARALRLVRARALSAAGEMDKSLAELKEEAERNFKAKVKAALVNIATKQAAVAAAQKNLDEARAALKEMKHEIVEPTL